MKIVFMGTPSFSVEALDVLAESHEICMVVTQPDRQRGRGKKVVPSPVKKRALELDLPVFQPQRLRDPEAMACVIAQEADVIVVVAFGQILPKEILQAPKYGCINIHASLLPKYRGAAPIQRAIQEGEDVSGVTIMQMDEGLDTGDMLAKEEILIPDAMTTGQLEKALSASGAKMILKVLSDLDRYMAERTAQDDSKATYASKISKDEAVINWHQSAEAIHNAIRAFDPFPGAWTQLGDTKLKLFASSWQAAVEKGKPGEITDLSDDCIFIQTGQGVLKIAEIQAPGKKRMAVSDFLRGRKLEKGVVLLSKE